MKYENVKLIQGDVFIIPNSLAHKDEFLGSKEEQKKQMERLVKSVQRCVDLPADTVYVQVWCVTPGSDDSNWQCHYEMIKPDEDPEEVIGENFPLYLPCSLFKGHKEGDKVYFQTRWGLVELTLNQKDYRYRRYGKFEDVLGQLSIKAGVKL